MSRVREVTPKVFDVLQSYPETRGDDKELVLKVYMKYYGVTPLTPFKSVMKNKKLPSFESIRRARQKIQSYYPDFRATDSVEEIRMTEQEDYIAYSQEELQA